MGQPQLAEVVHRNIQALIDARAEYDRRTSSQLRIADAITRFAGSMRFVYLHALMFGGWIVVNVGAIPGVEPFDPFPFVMLAMFASVEAIFLSTFVLISQNRQAELAEKRADLDLQISLLAEHEVTRIVTMVDAIGSRLGIEYTAPPDVEELKQDVRPEVVLREIDAVERRSASA